MRALLQACAGAWSQAGAAHLGNLVDTVHIPDRLAIIEGGVPDILRPDYDLAIASLTRFPDLQRQLLLDGPLLPWMQGSMKMPDTFRGKFAYVELAGPKGMLANSEISFGFYLQLRDTVYPSHWHEAEEDYLILSGTALWQTDNDGFTEMAPGSHIVHGTNQPHATTTGPEPLLAMWFWRGDIRDSTYRIVGVDQ